MLMACVMLRYRHSMVLTMTSRSKQLLCLRSSSSDVVKKGSGRWGLWVLFPALPLTYLLKTQSALLTRLMMFDVLFWKRWFPQLLYRIDQLAIVNDRRRKKKASFYLTC